MLRIENLGVVGTIRNRGTYLREIIWLKILGLIYNNLRESAGLRQKSIS